MVILLYPLLLLKFWYLEAFPSLLKSFISFNKYFLNLFSFWLLLATFFRPLKNEYRQGLVGFSVVLGILVKSVLITIALSFLCLILFVEFVFGLIFLALPVIGVYKILI